MPTQGPNEGDEGFPFFAPSYPRLRGGGAFAQIGLEEVDGEAEGHDEPEGPDALGEDEGGHADRNAPHENFAGEAVAPIGLGTAGRNARAQRRPEARNGVEIAAIALALRGKQACLFAQNQPIGKENHSQDEHDCAEAAGENRKAHGHQIVSHVKRVAYVAVGAFGDELL